MLEAIHIGSVVTAAVGACCAVGARRNRSAVVWLPELVMVAAMLDIITGVGLVAPMLWAAVLVGLALWVGIDVRMQRHAIFVPVDRHAGAVRGAMTVLRGTSLVVMGLLMLVMSAPVTRTGVGMSSHGVHEMTGGIVQQFVIACAAGVVGLGIWVATRLVREGMAQRDDRGARFFLRFLGPLEIVSMTSSLVLMSLAVVS